MCWNEQYKKLTSSLLFSRSYFLGSCNTTLVPKALHRDASYVCLYWIQIVNVCLCECVWAAGLNRHFPTFQFCFGAMTSYKTSEKRHILLHHFIIWLCELVPRCKLFSKNSTGGMIHERCLHSTSCPCCSRSPHSLLKDDARDSQAKTEHLLFLVTRGCPCIALLGKGPGKLTFSIHLSIHPYIHILTS